MQPRTGPSMFAKVRPRMKKSWKRENRNGANVIETSDRQGSFESVNGLRQVPSHVVPPRERPSRIRLPGKGYVRFFSKETMARTSQCVHLICNWKSCICVILRKPKRERLRGGRPTHMIQEPLFVLFVVSS